MIHRLDNYQIEGIKAITDSDISIITGNKSSGKSFLLRYLINKRWSSGKSTILIVPDISQAKIYQKHLGEFHLNKYSIILDNHELLSEKTLIKLRALHKEDKIDISKKDIQLVNLNFDKTLNKLKEYYSSLNKKLLFNKSFNQLVLINAFDSSSFKNIYFNQIFERNKFEFIEEEYNLLQNNVKKGYELQLRGEHKTDKYFQKKAYVENNPEKIWLKISIWLKESRIKILNVIQTIASLLHEHSSTQFSIERNKITEIIKRIDNLLLEIESFNIQFQDFNPEQSNFLGLDKNLKELKDKYSLGQQKIALDYKALMMDLYRFPTLKELFPTQYIEEQDTTKIQNHLETIISDSSSIEKKIQNSINKELKSMNFRNTKNEVLLNLQKDIDDLFIYLNNGFATKKWEDNAFSIHKQLLYLEHILEDLNIIEGQKANFFTNYNWNRFLHNLDEKSSYLIRKLNIYRPKNWMIFFKNYYIQNIILKYKHHIDIDISHLLNALVEDNNKKERLSELKSIKIWQNKRKLFINRIKNEDEQLFKNIFNQSGGKHELITKNDFSLLSEFIPVIIIPEDVFAKMKQKSLFNIDLIAYENTENLKQDLESLLLNNSKLLFSIDESEKITEIKKTILKNRSNSEIKVIELKGFHQQGMINLLDMNYSERLYAARNLAHLLQSTNNKIKIFQLKNTVIFSSLDEILNQVLLKLMDKNGIKEMRIIDTPFHLLVDNLLEINKKQILLTQNNLIDYKTDDNLLWQLDSIRKIRKGGVKIINFNTSSLLDNPIENIKNFVKTNLI